MPETEVESILREIRERVLSQERAGKDVTTTHTALTNGGNGAGESNSTQQIALGDGSENQIGASLSLISSYLTTTARTWDRLPPLVSNRSGFIAGVELWLKRQLKRTTRWFTWEQVNFNAATHHALRDLLPVLLAHEQELGRLRAQIAEAEARRSEQLSDLQTELQTAVRRPLEDKVDARLAEMANELRERDERLQEEQRVCFKQLALETSEAAVLEDRARRKTEASLEEIERRIAELENGET